MLKKKNSKIVKYRRYPVLNIGTVMFGLVFIYMIACVVMYLNTNHVTGYEVRSGTLSGNYRYSALVLKEELIINASQSGSVSYYARERSKVGKGGSVCAVDESGQSAEVVQDQVSELPENIDNASLNRLKGTISTFSTSFNPDTYQEIYDFQAEIESTILELTDEQSLADIGDSGGNLSGLMNLSSAPEEGIVVYSVDGYEDLQAEEVTGQEFDRKDYQRTNLRSGKAVTSGAPLYKLITDENWSMIIPLDTKMATELADKSSVRFRFLKDGTIFNADFSIFQNGEAYFGKLDMQNSLIRYAADRFLDIELLLERQSGLKILNSAVARKEFYKIPKEYATYEGEQPREIGLLRETYTSDGSAETKYIMATVYDEDEQDDSFYVDVNLFKEGDYVIKKDSSNKYQLKDRESLEGVYNINKGYAVFREIKVIDENEEYCIVEEGSTFGLSQYDYIVLDASTVDDEEIVTVY